jgi:hypothetical protein
LEKRNQNAQWAKIFRATDCAEKRLFTRTIALKDNTKAVPSSGSNYLTPLKKLSKLRDLKKGFLSMCYLAKGNLMSLLRQK